MATKKLTAVNDTLPKLEDTIRFRVPADLKPRLKSLALARRMKYQALVREALTNFVELEEARRLAAKAA